MNGIPLPFFFLCKLAILHMFCIQPNHLQCSEYNIPLTNLSLEEKIGQLLMVHFNGESANEEAKLLIQDMKIGGIIYYNWSNGLNSPLQVRELSHSLQELTKKNPHSIPLLIAVDQEGGKVARLKKGFTNFPSHQAIGNTQDSSLAERCASAIGEELVAVGVNMNLAPVLDVNSNTKNQVIGSRSFSTCRITVTLFGKSFIKGFHKTGVIATFKHFPGHGDVEIDSHEDLPRVNKTKEQLYFTDLYPFIELCIDADVIMTGHLLVPALDPLTCTTLSKPSLDFLKEELQFEGVIMSDSLVMKGLLKCCQSLPDAAIKALNAGCDILLLGGRQLLGENNTFEMKIEDIREVRNALINAVKEGTVSERRIDEALQRVAKLKSKYLYKSYEISAMPIENVVKTSEHESIADEIFHYFQIPEKYAKKIAEKVWKNECGGSIEGLTCWNKGENFASLGIGHFIWYPEGKKEHFQEAFPELLEFLEQQGAPLPPFINPKQGCLWNTREEFYENIDTEKMMQLRNFLFDSRGAQAIFIAQRLEKSLPGMVKELSIEEKQHIYSAFLLLKKNPQGLYAMIDYLNFKGAGAIQSESYFGKRWGLLQVLQKIPSSSKTPIEDFVAAAKEVLKERIEHSPPERNEGRWLKGWNNRLDTYLEPIEK